MRALSWHVVTVVDPMTRPVVEAVGSDLGEIEEIDAHGVAAAEAATGRLLDPDSPPSRHRHRTTGPYGGWPPGQHARRNPGPLACSDGRPFARAHQHWYRRWRQRTRPRQPGQLHAPARHLARRPCITRARHVLLASVSNWGAYGFTAMLEMLADRPLPALRDRRSALDARYRKSWRRGWHYRTLPTHRGHLRLRPNRPGPPPPGRHLPDLRPVQRTRPRMNPSGIPASAAGTQQQPTSQSFRGLHGRNPVFIPNAPFVIRTLPPASRATAPSVAPSSNLDHSQPGGEAGCGVFGGAGCGVFGRSKSLEGDQRWESSPRVC